MCAIALMMAALGGVGGWVSAQVIMPQPVVPPLTLSGDDIQFRVTARRGEVAVGRLMVRIDGQWVEADVNGFGVRRLQSQ
jgi:hypothetical protein